jgi:hypothetical protein
MPESQGGDTWAKPGNARASRRLVEDGSIIGCIEIDDSKVRIVGAQVQVSPRAYLMSYVAQPLG